MPVYNLDLHIHTVLSPCADLLMTPGNILKQADDRGLDIIAVTDHNSARNVEMTMQLAENTDLVVIPGMEVESKEEIHLLCLFDKLEQVLAWQEVVYQALPDRKNDEELFGFQLITDIKDKYTAKEERLLATATDMTVYQVVEKVSLMGGIVIPSHIDRKYNSIIANLGFIPPDLNISLLEVSRNGDFVKLQQQFKFLKKYSFIKNSDSHYLKDINIMTKLELENKNIKDIVQAILNR